MCSIQLVQKPLIVHHAKRNYKLSRKNAKLHHNFCLSASWTMSINTSYNTATKISSCVVTLSTHLSEHKLLPHISYLQISSLRDQKSENVSHLTAFNLAFPAPTIIADTSITFITPRYQLSTFVTHGFLSLPFGNPSCTLSRHFASMWFQTTK